MGLKEKMVDFRLRNSSKFNQIQVDSAKFSHLEKKRASQRQPG
jgi:hypothetical protein